MKAGIIGGGISGLTVAYFLQKSGIPYDLFEASDQPGGKIKSLQVKNYVLEMGPNTLQYSEELQELIQELKLEDDLLFPEPVSNDRFILKQGHYEKLPASPVALFTSNFFSLKTKLRIAQEHFVAQANIPDETIAHFFERRLCREVVDYLVNPLIAGIFAGDPEKLLIRKTFPVLQQYEREHGSILAGMLKNSQVQRRQQVFTLKSGLQTLPKAIATKLISLHTGQSVEMITRSQGRYILSTNPPVEFGSGEYDVIVVALPAQQAASLLEFTSPGLSAALQNVYYPPLAVVHSVYPKDAVRRPMQGFGGLHPQVERMFTAGNIWTSSIFPDRCGPNETAFTSFVGGAMYTRQTSLTRQEIMERVHLELKYLFDIQTEKPSFQYFYLWPQALPQFDLYIEDAHQLAASVEPEGIFIATNWEAGVSVPSCIRHAKNIAKKISSLATKKQSA